MPSDVMWKVMTNLHRAVIHLSDGRVGWRIGGARAVEVTTTGRHSDAPRTVMLNAFDGPDGCLAIAASRGGDDRHPDWFLNLQKHPAVLIRERGSPARPMDARVADEDERARIYTGIAQRHASYARYARRTARVIPVVLLEPRRS